MHDFSWALHQVNRKKGCTISWNRFSTPDTAFESQFCKETKPTTDFKNEFKNWVGCSFTHDGSVEGINPASNPPSRNTLYPIYARAPKWLFPIRGGMLRSLLQGGASWNLRKNLVTDTSQLVQRRCDQLGHIIFFWRSHSKSMLLLPTQKPWCQCQSSRACSATCPIEFPSWHVCITSPIFSYILGRVRMAIFEGMLLLSGSTTKVARLFDQQRMLETFLTLH